LDDTNAGLTRPRIETLLVGRRQRDRVETSFGIHELGLEAREIDDREPVTGLGVERPAIDLELVLTEVRLYVFRRVDPREIDPRLVARIGPIGAFDEDAHLREREEISAGDDIGVNDRKSKRSKRGDDQVLLGSGWEVDDEGVGFGSEFDLEICGGGG
jgi:hypothetical protein